MERGGVLNFVGNAFLYYKQGYFRDSQFGCYLTLYDSLLRYTKAPRLLILVHCPFEEILR